MYSTCMFDGSPPTLRQRVLALAMLGVFCAVCLNCALGEWDRDLFNGYSIFYPKGGHYLVTSDNSVCLGGRSIVEMAVSEPFVVGGVGRSKAGGGPKRWFIVDTSTGEETFFDTAAEFEAALAHLGFAVPPELKRPHVSGFAELREAR